MQWPEGVHHQAGGANQRLDKESAGCVSKLTATGMAVYRMSLDCNASQSPSDGISDDLTQPADMLTECLLVCWCQIRAVDVAHRTAEKDASAWQKQMELSQLQHQKQIQTAKARCRLLQAERDALTMALSAVAFELVSPECTESGLAVCLAALSGLGRV